VRVAPELVEVRPGQSPRTRWGELFDAGPPDVFEVPAMTAGMGVSALDGALADSARTELISTPTERVAAYDPFLTGAAAAAAGSPSDQRRAVAYYQEAIRRDSSFALAWARLARASAILYVNVGAVPEVAALNRQAAGRARRLAPNHPETYTALTFTEAYINGNPERALAIAEEGLRIAPNNADLLAAAASQEQALGRFEAAATRLERGFAIDPRSAVISRRLGYAMMVLRRYDEAKIAFERGLTLAPGNLDLIQNMALAALGQGDVEAVRNLCEHPPRGVTRDQLLAYLAQYEELGWALDDRQQARVLELGPEFFDNDRAAFAIVRAHLHFLRGQRAQQRAWADTAEAAFGEQLRGASDDPQRLVIHGVALAYLGRHADAIREGKRAVEILPPSRDMYFGTYVQHQLVRIYLLAGEPERALDALEPLLAMPYTLTPAWLRIDPMFDPLRNHPRFQKLVGGAR
jgi:serine/threonine-protein kinase